MKSYLKPRRVLLLVLLLLIGVSVTASPEARSEDDTAIRLEGDGVAVYDAMPGNARVLPYTSLFKWRPSSDQAAILVDDQLAMFDASTGDVTTTSIPAEPFSDTAWSPDGAYFAFTQRSGDRLYARLFNPATGKATTLARSTSGSYGGQIWSSAGQYLVIHQD